MALIKKEEHTKSHPIRRFDTFLEAQAVFESGDAPSDERLAALEYIVEHKEIYYILDILSKLFIENRVEDHKYIDAAFIAFRIKPKREKDFEAMFRMLKSDNAYLRNAVIGFLQEYGREAKPFIERLMADEDRDIRIFAINILGDVRFEDSVEMLRRFIVQERDINALMTAVDYLGEIGEKSDVELLEAIKKDFSDPYVDFGVDLAIRRIRGEA